jgi:deoxyribodipyrimidine photo-lyase
MSSPTASLLSHALVWLRRDLRLEDNAALFAALKAARQVHCCFVFDTDILAPLPKADRRVEFIHASVQALDADLRDTAKGHGTAEAGLLVRHGTAVEEIVRLATALGVQAVYASHDAEPAALARDAKVRGALADKGIVLHTVKDHVIFERDEVLTQSGNPYSVFTPYKNAWLKMVTPFYLSAWPVERYANRLAALPLSLRQPMPTLADLGFEPSGLAQLRLGLGASGGRAMLAEFLERIDHYGQGRDFPAIKAPSYLGVHLRFGTVSIRRCAREAWQRTQAGSRGAEVWLSELIWRDFYHQILHHHPRVVGHAFKPEYDAIKWEHGKQAEARFAAWCEGRTGYPLVDAGMLQLHKTGYMHNRLRMVTACFLVKDLGLDWRRGEAWFAQHLNDFDLAANNGGWQWAASTGCDAQPYFRIFNPVSQSEKFDPEGKFIKRYLPQLAALPAPAIHAPWRAKPMELMEAGLVLGKDYPEPIVDHDEARQQTLERFGVAKAKTKA